MGSTAPHFDHFFEAFGSHTTTEPAVAQCLGARQAGFYATYGVGITTPEPVDFRNSKSIVLIGNHVGENMHKWFSSGLFLCDRAWKQCYSCGPKILDSSIKS